MDDATEAQLVRTRRSHGLCHRLPGHEFHQSWFALVLAATETPQVLRVLVIRIGFGNLWSGHCIHQWSRNPALNDGIVINLAHSLHMVHGFKMLQVKNDRSR